MTYQELHFTVSSQVICAIAMAKSLIHGTRGAKILAPLHTAGPFGALFRINGS